MLRGRAAPFFPLSVLLLLLDAGQGSHGAAAVLGGWHGLQVAAVTGGASGIGYALAKKCLRNGVHVVLSDGVAQRLGEAADALQAEAAAFNDGRRKSGGRGGGGGGGGGSGSGLDHDYEEMAQAMDVLNMSEEEKRVAHVVVAAVLHPSSGRAEPGPRRTRRKKRATWIQQGKRHRSGTGRCGHGHRT
jgi:hypothetical protein